MCADHKRPRLVLRRGRQHQPLGLNGQARGHLALVYGDTAVGEVCSRINESEGEKRIYMMTI